MKFPISAIIVGNDARSKKACSMIYRVIAESTIKLLSVADTPQNPWHLWLELLLKAIFLGSSDCVR